ncbi:heavy-metal-associated domain-containing protein [Brucepastera parasyntrophica]|uniref:heavy-metal-associated domain-containing protein n=1 Tax=Brucepastera parasyntrophica TaxID=2880008 RepID=UPI00210C261A|nr:heavy-metal-associated domain-containing protein [Brucepastera parasyntrophica]ULQ59146.1 heavy-metal-associated domain-containing protein [Brucepastera parasyntrophica]
MTKTIQVSGMSCGHCVKRVENALKNIPGVTKVSVNLDSGSASITSGRDIASAELASAISEAGFTLAE